VEVDGHVSGEDLFIGKNPDLMRLAGLQLVEEFAAPLLPLFLSIWGKKKTVATGRSHGSPFLDPP
jgi:hypothetical protein